jgi:hypothetical protein
MSAVGIHSESAPFRDHIMEHFTNCSMYFLDASKVFKASIDRCQLLVMDHYTNTIYSYSHQRKSLSALNKLKLPLLLRIFV